MHIQTDRLLIRRLLKSDISTEYIENLNDPEINTFLSTRGIKQTIDSLINYVDSYSGKVYGLFNNGKHVGNITIFSDNIGILIFKNHQRKGYAREALMAFKEFGLDRASINEENTASYNLFKSCGFFIKLY